LQKTAVNFSISKKMTTAQILQPTDPKRQLILTSIAVFGIVVFILIGSSITLSIFNENG